MQDPLLRALAMQLKNGLPFPEGHKEGDPRTAVFQLLFGAIMGLSEAKQLIDHAGESFTGDVNTQELVDDFLDSEGTGSPWAGTPPLRGWSIGYFIGKSTSNICAALDRSVNIWLSNRLYGPTPPHEQRLDNIFHSYIVARLRCIEVMAPEYCHLLELMRKHMSSDLIDTEFAFDAMKKPRSEWAYPSDTAVFSSSSVSDQEAAAVALMWARNNAFKHQPRHYPRSHRSELTSEHTIAVLGLSAVIKLASALGT